MGNIDSLFKIALQNLALGRYDEAMRNYLDILQIEPSNIDAKVELAGLIHREGDSEGAFKFAKNLVAENPKSWESHFCLGSFYLRELEYETAKECFKIAVACVDEPLVKSFLELYQFLCEERFEEMLLRIHELKEKNIEHPSISLFHSLIMFTWGRDKSGEKAITEFIAKYPDLAVGYLVRGLVRFNQQMWQVAISDLGSALTSAGSDKLDSSAIHLTIGISRFSVHDFLNALEDFNYVIDHGGDIGIALYYRANIYIVTQQLDLALQDIQDSLYKYEYRNAGSLTVKSQILLALQKHNDAEIVINEAIKLDQHNGIAHCLRGWIYLHQNRIEEAISEMDIGYSLEPHHAQSQFSMACVESVRGNVAKARMHIEKAREYGLNVDENTFKEMVSSLSIVNQTTIHVLESEEENIFRLKGDYWEVRYNGGEIFRYKNRIGMQYLDKLLHFPNKIYKCEEFGKRSLIELSENVSMAHGLEVDRGTSGDRMENYSKEIRNKLKELEVEYQEVLRLQIPERERLLKEIKTEENEILQKINKSKWFEVSKNKKNAAWRVSKSIKETIELIYKSDESLGKHLQNSITAGFEVCYSPSKLFHWN